MEDEKIELNSTGNVLLAALLAMFILSCVEIKVKVVESPCATKAK